MAPEASVAVTGCGIVSPGAVGYEQFVSMLRGGESAIAPIEEFSQLGYRSRAGGRVTDFQAKDFIKPAKLRRLNRLSRFGLAAASMAISSARLELPEEQPVGVALGTSFGPVETSVNYMEEYLEKGPSLAPPQLFAESVANAPGSHIAIEWSLKGFNVTFTQRETSALTAAGYAALRVASGAVHHALIGGVEEINDVLYGVLDSMGALARSRSEGNELVRPFDARRNGLLPGEGGAVLVLERAPRAGVLCWIRGWASGRDVTAPLAGWGTGSAAVARVMREAIADASLDPGSIDAVCASANGSVPGDLLEARALEQVFDREIPPVFAPKSFFGEYAGGGALQLAAAVAAVDQQTVWSTPGFEQSLEEVEMPVAGGGEGVELRHVLVNSLAAGGNVVSMVLSREAS